jgi:hypothetical protein
MALRPHLAAGLPFAPKHWQIHHRTFIDHTGEDLIPEIGAPKDQNFDPWTRVPGKAPKSD